ncbi:hypothetical protein RHGRI_009902 [Rhododendron griersonianum]|uniref:F-box domain-containing protein n=1 Tax=Rhododendron griersonianum TaxID=479676 RepID=A0AAV6KGH0_9ERIC|nr:hypothetical protein RHGRI_009902 [Rhododendron griersonianum]
MVDEEDSMRGSKRNETQNTVALPKKKTRRSKKNAAAPMSELPNHIMSDILSRLPLKSIFRCKRVCKAWQNVILEPYFAELHLSRSPLSLIFYRNGNSNNNNDDNSSSSSSHFEIFQLHDPPISGYRIARMKFSTEIYFPHMDIRVVASCNGLVLLSNHPSRDLVIVCNPLRAQRFILPKPQRLAVPYSRSDIGFGFGHSLATGQYKVLRYIRTYTPPISMEFDIYTLGIDNEWRSLRYTAKPPTIYDTLVFLNGALHWIGNEKTTIFYFDIEKEQFGSFPLPSHIGDHCKALAVVDNQLYIHNRYSYGGLQFWAMKDYGDFGSWTLEWDIEASITRGFDPICEPLKMLRDGSLLMMCYSLCSRKQVIKITLASYNPQTRVLKEIKHRGILLWGASVADVPCLFSPMGFEMAILKS